MTFERPLELVFVRHGESEGNVANKAAENGDDSHFTSEFRARHSSSWNLTKRGEQQARIAGEWIRHNVHDGIFDAYYASTYVRAARTAGLLDLPKAQWSLKDYIREHDWGNLDVMTDDERREKHPDVMKQQDIHPYYFSAPGGESLADVVIRVRVGIIATLYRELQDGKTGIIVSHGNIMWPVRIIMEDIHPNEYLVRKKRKSPADKINNCQILQYTRVHPETKKVSERFEWMRMVNPWNYNPSLSVWRPVKHTKYTNEELVALTE